MIDSRQLLIKFFAPVFLLATLGPFARLSAQHTLRGRVADSATTRPLDGARIFIPELTRSTLAASSGSFRFENLPEGNFQLVISQLGRITGNYTVRLPGPDTVLYFGLGENTETLSTVTIQAGRETAFDIRRLRAVEGAAIYEGKKSEVVELRDLSANLAANNPRQIYARVAGLNIWESDGAGLQLGIGGRGLSPNRTANFNTRQNGYDISADALGYPESYYTPAAEALERIEVVRGAASLQYGTQFGGMLNFVFKKPAADKKIHLNSRQTLGSFGFRSSYNEVSGTLAGGKFSYLAYYQYKTGDGWRPNSGFAMHQGFAALRWKPTERLSLGVEATRMRYLAQQAGGLTDALFEQNPRRSYRERNWFRVDWNLLAATLDFRLTDRTRLDVRTFGLVASRQSLGVLSPVNVVDFGQERDLIDGRFRNLGNETRLLHRYQLRGREHTLVLGARLYRGNSYTRQGLGTDGSGPDFFYLHPEQLENSDYRFPNANVALFAEQIFYLSERWSLTPGIRYEHIKTRAEGYFNQRVYDAAGNLIGENRQEERQVRRRNFVLLGLGLSWKPERGGEFYANFSQNYRAINFSDLRIDNPNNRVDPNIGDERGYTADLGWRMPSGRVFYADLTAFYRAYNNRIGQVLRSGEPPLYNDYRLRANIADARNLGLECLLEMNLWVLFRPSETATKLSVFVNAAVIDARYVHTEDASIRNRKVELVPPVTWRGGLSFRRLAWRASFIWAYTGEHFTDATNARRTASAVNGLIPAYAVADFSVGWKWRFLRLDASCNNLFDARYFTRRAEAYPGPGIIPADGRSVFLTLGVAF
ncbi:MAG: TonB-dependent receptor [Saprospiraceae bacterium]|nr:TonB-dependent receptor [Saprospiraceae bacterium]